MKIYKKNTLSKHNKVGIKKYNTMHDYTNNGNANNGTTVINDSLVSWR